MKDRQLTEHFKISEFQCKCNNCNYPDTYTNIRTVTLLEMLHAFLLATYDSAIRIVVTSGIRCSQHNTDSDGYPGSRHTYDGGGDAADIKCYYQFPGTKRWVKINPKEIYYVLNKRFPNSLGLGLYKRFNHIDTRIIRARW